MTRDPLRAAKRLFRRLNKCNKACISKTGDIDPASIADILEHALEDDVSHRAVMLALAEFIGNALDGGVMDMEDWRYPEK